MRMYLQIYVACKCVYVCINGFALTAVAGLHGHVYESMKKILCIKNNNYTLPEYVNMLLYKTTAIPKP